MADTFGGIAFPIPVASGAYPVGDKALGVVAEYLSAVLNSKCGSAWSASGICPGRPVVKRWFTHDPKYLFDDSKLPALYVWSGKSTTAFVASDIPSESRAINILWVIEGAQPEHHIKRAPIFNAIAKTIQWALRKGRDTSWKVLGDAEQYAATEGSLYMDHAGFSRVSRGISQPQELEVYIVDGDGRPMPFYGLATSIDVVEHLTDDTSIGTYDSHIDVGIANSVGTEMGTIEDLP